MEFDKLLIRIAEVFENENIPYMVKGNKQIQEMEDEFIRRNKMTVQEKFDMSDSLYKIALSSGELKIDDSQQNLETLIKTLKVFRDASKTAD